MSKKTFHLVSEIPAFREAKLGRRTISKPPHTPALDVLAEPKNDYFIQNWERPLNSDRTRKK